MIKRIVKMSFEPGRIADFKALFEANKHLIGGFAGCTHLELWQDVNNPSLFFTYSFWNSEGDLENYRNSELFKRVWSHTKPLFNDKPQAWTVQNA